MGANSSEDDLVERPLNEGGDHIEDVHIQGVSGAAVAVGRGARAAVYHGLSLDEVAQTVSC